MTFSNYRMTSHDYIFRKTKSGIKFIGDFESFYLNENDPWEQSASKNEGKNNEMANFYEISRHKLTDFLGLHINDNDSICECGCGTGYVTESLLMKFPNQEISGCDISKTAIEKASQNFQNIGFFQHDILSSPLPQKYNVLILSNILWYVIHDFENLIVNSLNSLNRERESLLVVQNALFKSGQKYFQDIVNSIGTMSDLFTDRLLKVASIGFDFEINTKFIRRDEMNHDFGILLIKIPKI